MKAQEASSQAHTAAAQAEETAKRIARTEEDLRQQVLSVTKMFYLQVATRMETGGQRCEKAANIITEELNTAIRRALPDDQERNRFIRDLEKLLPPKGKKQAEPANK